jgi:hypothetical protein
MDAGLKEGDMVSSFQRTGRAAAASGVLMFVGVEGEWVFNPQRDDGTVTNMPAFALLLLTATVGFALLFIAVVGLRAQTACTTRPARTGSFTTLAGAGLLVVFGLVALVTALLRGSPLEASFIAFLLAMLLLAVGPVTWGLSLRRRLSTPGVWQLLLLSGVAAFGALAIEPDPWHDISLTLMFAAWSALGASLMRQARQRASTGMPDHTASRLRDRSGRSRHR